MAIITRTAKGSPLTTSELDNNFSELSLRLVDVEEATVFNLGQRDNVAAANAYLVSSGLTVQVGMYFINDETGTFWRYDTDGWKDTLSAYTPETANSILTKAFSVEAEASETVIADNDSLTVKLGSAFKVISFITLFTFIIRKFQAYFGMYNVRYYGAVGNGATNDGPAINAAIAAAGVGGKVIFPPGVYATSVTISNSNDGQQWIGSMGGSMFSGGSAQGSVLKWIGASGGKLAYFGCLAGGSQDLYGGGIEGITFDGNSLAATCLHLRSCNFSNFRQIKAINPNSTGGLGILQDSDVQARAGVNSMYRCNFYNTAIFVSGTARGMFLTGASDETTGKHPAFCSFHGLHVRHENGDALHFESADDILVSDYGVSKVALGTGRGVYMKGKSGPSPAATYVAGCTFTQITVGSNDTPKITIDGPNVKGIAIYGIQGVDAAPTLELLNGAIKPIWDCPGSLASGHTDARRISPPIEMFNIAKADSETLDFYKERTFTPQIFFGGASVGVTYSTQLGRATRIGDTVHFVIQINLSALGSSTGNFQVGSLPWAVSTSPTVSVPNVRLSAMATGFTMHTTARISTTNIFVEKMVSGTPTNATLLTHADFTASSTIWISGSYHTDSTSA